MFGESEFIQHIRQPLLQQLFSEMEVKENQEPQHYGESERVPVIFFESRDKNGNPRIVARTPLRKIIFPGNEMKDFVEPGVLYWLKLGHRPNYAYTEGVDYRTSGYWTAMCGAPQKKIQAIRELRARYTVIHGAEMGLREAKDIADHDDAFRHNLPFTVTASSAASNAAASLAATDALKREVSILKSQVRDLENDSAMLRRERDNANFRARAAENDLQAKRGEVDSLSDELAGALKELAGFYAKGGPQKASTDVSIPSVWDIIGCNSSDEPDLIRMAIREGLMKYHTDRYNDAGPLVKKFGNSILQKIIQLKEQMQRQNQNRR